MPQPRKNRSPKAPPAPAAAAVATAIADWFPRIARDLPWRRTLDPYAVWVSEIMLQQTQVRTVIPYWERWMRELPTAKALAEADEAQVLRLWEGLGYYSRCRNLQRAANAVVSLHGGTLPSSPEELLELPGIGRYTAGAIASIAFNRPAPILDGNVVRVLARVHAIPGDPRERATSDQLWDLAAAVVAAAEGLPSRRSTPAGMVFAGACSVVNQGLMELGATTCSVASPDCGSCPLRQLCRGHRTGKATRYPAAARRKPTVARRFATVIWTHQGHWLLRKRPDDGHNAGLWELLNLEVDADGDACGALAHWLGVRGEALVPAGRLRRTITHNRITEEVFRLEHAPMERMPSGTLAWADAGQLRALPMVAKHRALLKIRSS